MDGQQPQNGAGAAGEELGVLDCEPCLVGAVERTRHDPQADVRSVPVPDGCNRYGTRRTVQQALGDRAGQQAAHRPAMARTDDNGIGFLGLGEAVQALRGRARRHDARLDAVALRNRIDQHVLRVRAQDLLTLGRARRVGEFVRHDRHDQQLSAGDLRQELRKREPVRSVVAAVVAGDQLLVGGFGQPRGS